MGIQGQPVFQWQRKVTQRVSSFWVLTVSTLTAVVIGTVTILLVWATLG